MERSRISPQAQMNRVVSDGVGETESEAMPTHGEGSEYGWEKREEARRRRFGITSKPKNPEMAPWSLRLGGKAGKRYTGRKESGFNNNSSYYVLTQCPDGAFEAMPISSWYNFTPDINYQTLTMDEAEEEFSQRHKTINYFARMVKKRLDNKEEEQSESATSTALKTASRAPGLRIHDDEEQLSSSGDEDEEDPKGKISKTKTAQLKKKKKKGPVDAGEESNASSEEDGYIDSKEVDYMSDSSSEEEKEADQSKPEAKDDLNAEEDSSSSEEDDGLTNEGKKLKEILDRDAGGRDSNDDEDDDEDEDPDADPTMGGTSALFLQGQKGKKAKSGSGTSSSSNSRSSTPTISPEAAASTIAAAANKLKEDKPAKGKKRPKGTESDDDRMARASPLKRIADSDSPASKKARMSPGQSNSGTSTPTPSVGGEDSSVGITDEAVRRYLTRKPMTTKDLLQKFKTKKTGLTNKQTIELIAAIVKRLKPEQKTIKGKMYLSLKPT